MDSRIESSVVRGRRFGGVMILVHKSIQKCTKIVCWDERFVIVIVENLLIVNVYLPCAGSDNRLFIYQEVFDNIMLWIDQYPDKDVIFGGDLNVNLESRDVFCDLVNQFVLNNGFISYDHLFLGLIIARITMIAWIVIAPLIICLLGIVRWLPITTWSTRFSTYQTSSCSD